MNTPIADFIKKYVDKNTVRAHMPGHKGKGDVELFDITEIDGADSLFHADGIIAQSESNASAIFGCHTFYSTEGSSLCIRAMLYLLTLCKGRRPRVLAARNSHRSFISACALLDVGIEWLYGQGYLCCDVSPKELSARFERGDVPDALYVTSPDYLGHIQDIAGICDVCRSYGVITLVDNAHGAYLKFLGRHPIDLGADIVCDSAHKTLPVLTGGAYLHISDSAPTELVKYAKTALALFGSTSPSYVILRSLDMANACLDGYAKRLDGFIKELERLKNTVCALGIPLFGDEPLKLTLMPKRYGYSGCEFADELCRRGVVCEFADPDYTVLMLTPENSDDIDIICRALSDIPKKDALKQIPPQILPAVRVMSVREAMLLPYETLPACECEGRVAASFCVACPPAVPIVVSGERIDKTAIAAFEYYGAKTIDVIKE